MLVVEDHAFTLTPEARALAPLLAALTCKVLVTTVFSPEDATSGEEGWQAARRSSLDPPLAHGALHQVVAARPAAGIRQATDELEADLLGLLDQGHGWAHKMFSGSVIAHTVRAAQMPVLLLSAHLPTTADGVN